jgi:hypothetical protein
MQLLTRFTLTFVTTCTLWTTNTTIAQQIHQVSAEVCQYCHAKNLHAMERFDAR